MTGARGQKCLISGYHMVFTWCRELGLAMEKHKTTTSDLQREEGQGPSLVMEPMPCPSTLPSWHEALPLPYLP